MAKLTEQQLQIRTAAEQSLDNFIRLVAPHRVLGSVHTELCSWWEKEESKSHQLTLLPRDHCKSAMIAYRAAYYIAKYPDCLLYTSDAADE